MEDIVIKQDPAGAEAPKVEDQKAPEGQRPDWLLPKFKTPEDQARAYIELEKMKGNPPPAAAEKKEPPKEEGKPKEPAAGDPDTEVRKELAQHQIDFDGLTTEYTENGTLKDESYAALEKVGIPRSVVDEYISGRNAAAQQAAKEVYDSVGGENTFTAMIDWAKAHMSEADITAYNKSVDAGVEQAKLAVAGLHAKYIKATGGDPNLIGGTPANSVAGYRSFSEQLRDQQDPRYKADPAFREEVQRKALASRF